MNSRLFLASALTLSVMACDASTTSSGAAAVPAAVIADAQPVPAPAANAVGYAFDQTTSKVAFVGAKITGSHAGGFQAFTGEVRMGADATTSSVNVTIDMGSVTSDSEKLTGHLKSPDFFDADTFKTATFTSTAVVAGGTGGTHTVTGNLSLHGVTKSVRFPATITTSAEQVTVKTTFAVNRKAFNINYPGKANDLIKDDVELTLDVTAKKMAAAPAPADGGPAAGTVLAVPADAPPAAATP